MDKVEKVLYVMVYQFTQGYNLRYGNSTGVYDSYKRDDIESLPADIKSFIETKEVDTVYIDNSVFLRPSIANEVKSIIIDFSKYSERKTDLVLL